MFAFLKRMMEKRCNSILIEARPVINNGNLNVIADSLEVARLSFQVKDLDEKSTSVKEKNKLMKKVLIKMDRLYHWINNNRADATFDDIVFLAVAYYNIGLVYAHSKGDSKLQTAFAYLKISLILLKENKLDCKAILTYIGALNEINSVFYTLVKDKYTCGFLKVAMDAYLGYTKEDNYPNPIYIGNIIGTDRKELNSRIILETLHFTTLRDLATLYFLHPQDKHQFVKYMHDLVKGQLSEAISQGREFQLDSLNLALTLFDMSKYFLINNRFVEARNYLVTADYVTHRFCKDTLKTANQQSLASNDTTNAESNDVSTLRLIYLSDNHDYVCGVSSRSWGSYGVSLLRFWLNKFLQNKSEISELDNLEMKSEEQLAELIFSDLINEEEFYTKERIANTRILSLSEANFVFTEILKYLDEAKAYFTADDDLETYAKIMLDVSAAHKYLAGFEHRKDIQLKLHKERVECLQNVCKKLYTITHVGTEFYTCKRVWYEMVSSCSTVMDLMFEEEFYNEFKNTSNEVDRFAKLILQNIYKYLYAYSLDF